MALADALGISIAQLAGKVSYDPDLSGERWCAWQTWKDGTARIDTHPLEVHQRGELLQLDAAVRSKGAMYLPSIPMAPMPGADGSNAHDDYGAILFGRTAIDCRDAV